MYTYHLRKENCFQYQVHRFFQMMLLLFPDLQHYDLSCSIQVAAKGPTFVFQQYALEKILCYAFLSLIKVLCVNHFIKLHEKLKLNDNPPLILLLNFCDFLSWSCRKVVYTTNHKYTDNNNGSTEIENCISNFQHYICTKLISIQVHILLLSYSVITNESNGEKSIWIELTIDTELKLVAKYNCKEENNNQKNSEH